MNRHFKLPVILSRDVMSVFFSMSLGRFPGKIEYKFPHKRQTSSTRLCCDYLLLLLQRVHGHDPPQLRAHADQVPNRARWLRVGTREIESRGSREVHFTS